MQEPKLAYPITRRSFLKATALAGGAVAIGFEAPAVEIPGDALALHRSSLVVDLHIDSFLWVRLVGYDMGKRHENHVPYSPFGWHVDLPRCVEGGLGAAGFGIVVNPRTVRPELMLPLKLLSWYESERGIDAVLHTLELMRETAKRNPERFAVVGSGRELRAARAAGKVAGIPCLEGAHGIEGSLDNLRRAHDKGLRSVGLVHFQATEAGYPMTVGDFDGRGLTPFGRDLIAEMERLSMIVDLAHLNDAGVAEALDVMKRPFMVSHTACRALYPHRRNLTDEQIRTIADRGGVIGIAFEGTFLAARGANLDRALDHFDHAINVGGAQAVGIGSDWDGFIVPAAGLEDVTTLPSITAGLLRRGHSPDTVQKVLGENALRVFTEVCG